MLHHQSIQKVMLNLGINKGFESIASRHFTSEYGWSENNTKIVMMVSHSDGYSTFLKLHDKSSTAGKP